MKSIGQRMREILEVWSTGKTEACRKFAKENGIPIVEIGKSNVKLEWKEPNEEQANLRLKRSEQGED